MARSFVIKPDDQQVSRELIIDYKAALNPQQLDVVQSPGGPALVIAGAGTGKTRTLIYRVAYLVETGVLPQRIVLLTFTRRAAAQMVDRAASLLDGRCRDVRGGTFHSFCLSILRRYADRVGLPPVFTVIDESDAADVVNLIRTSKGYHKLEQRFPRKEALRSMFSAAVNRRLTLQQIVESDYPQFIGHLDRIREVQVDYTAYKGTHGLVDYDDLLLHTHRIMESAPDVRRQIAVACEHVLVDEYQDTNRLQALLVDHLASVHHNVMVVGDDAQSIYRFRGADYRNLFEFKNRQPGTRLFTIEQNYRSTQPILDLANEVIQQARTKFAKHLFTRRQGGDLPGVVPCPDERTESKFVAQMILQLREEDVPLNRIAVLFRSSHSSFDLELELARRSIPFVKYGGVKLSEAAHVKDVVAYLRVLENPADAVAWGRILTLLEGIGPKTAGEIVRMVTRAPDPLTTDPTLASTRYVESIRRLFETLRGLREAESTLAEEVEAVVAYYDPILRRRYPDDAEKRMRDLDHFVGLARTSASRQTFLSELVLDPVELTAVETRSQIDDEPPLILSTIHSAKGLEFHTVFVIQVLEGSLPSAYALDDDESIDEELRLFYVAITRGETNLFITYPSLKYSRGQGDYFANPSRFIEGLGPELLEPWQIVSASQLPAAPEDKIEGNERV
ncbi:MAG TPA: ATP-dependent helicase [Rhodothermales bacterium]